MIDINNLFQTCRNYILNVWKLWGEKTSEPRLPTSIVFSSMEVALHHHDAVQHLFISVVGMILRCMLQTNHHHSPLCGHNLTLFCSFNTSPLPPCSATMPLSMQSQSDDDQYVLVATLDNARNLSNILKAIAFKDHAIFTATPNGLRVTVEDSKCLQANAFIQVCFSLLDLLNSDCNSNIELYIIGCNLPGVHHQGRSGGIADQPHSSAGLSQYFWRKHSTRWGVVSSKYVLLQVSMYLQ